MRRLRALAALLFLLLLVLTPRLARADRFPAGSAIVAAPNDPKALYARTTFGMLASRDAGESWSWICKRAIGFSSADEDPVYAVTPKGTLVVGTSAGLAVSRDNGCSFAFAGGAGAHVLADLTLRANGDLTGVTSRPGPSGSTYDNHLVISSDDLQTVAVSGGPIGEGMRIGGVRVAESDPARIYLSAVRGEDDKRAALVLASVNAGMSWVEHPIELVAGETELAVVAIDPKNAERIYVRTGGANDTHGRLLVSDDGGKAWKTVFEVAAPLAGFALAADGAQVYVGSREGFASSPTDAFSFTKGEVAPIQCLGLAGTAIWGCSIERTGFFLGVSRHSHGKNFDGRLRLEQLKGPLECPVESSVAKQCTAEWEKLRVDLGVPDPGAKAKSTAPGGPALRGKAAPRGRSVRGGFGAIAAAAFLGLAGYMLFQRFRRRR